jgi:hypothetical protein
VAKKAFALRIDERLMEAMQGWADDELRSLNAQIEYVLREGLRKNGRLKATPVEPIEEPVDDENDRKV